ncbi:MAG TPA: outer membrane beta-barrel family protein [Mucilaginibacter sp.]|nr:outer membrane beta-barrel family protein [Mucilaginibacter sp.]
MVSLLLLISFGASASLRADDDVVKGQVTGKVIDSVTKAPVSYATISIYKANSTSPFNGVVTDDNGAFTLNNISAGQYRIAVDFIGYRKKSIGNVVISKGSPTVSLGTIVLAPAQNQLKTVEIVSKAPVVENKIDKMVYNVTNDLTAQGASAAEVLQKVPQVTVDIDGNVELQGNSNIKFLINGKPSSIFGASLADALQSIPASQIKTIEVITSPGAKYDAGGTGGIINIVLKDSKIQGVNGSINLSAGTRRESGSLNLNVRKGNFGVNAFFNGGEMINSTTVNTTNRQSFNSTRDTSTLLAQNGRSNFTRGGFQSGISLNWDLTPKDQLTVSGGYNHFANHNSGLTNQEQTAYDVANNNIASDILSLRNSNSRFSGKYFDYSVAYKKTFKTEGQELNILYNSSYGRNSSSFFQQQDYLNGGYPSSGSTSNNPGKDHETDISIDYTQPFSKKFTVEAGAKAVLEDINNTIVTDTLSGDAFVPNPDQTYGFNYNRKIYAGYLSATFSLFNDFIDGKAGLRDEYTTTSADFPNTHIPGYNTIAPSAVLSHKIDATQSFKLSYTYRIERPEYRDLNPFYDISDPHNISTGNPNLRPEIGHNYEFGYNKTFNQGANIYVGVFYRHNTNDIQSYTTFYDTLTVGGNRYSNVSLNQRYNIGTETTEGVSLFGSIPVTSKLSLRSNMMFSDRITTNPGNPDVSGFMYRINLNATYQFPHDFTAEAFVNYNSSQRTIQGTRPVFAFYNLAVRKQFMKKKLSLGLTASDPFSQYINQRSTTSGANFYQSNLRQVPFRSFGITLSYRFGKLDFKKDKDKEKNKDDNSMPDNSENGGK